MTEIALRVQDLAKTYPNGVQAVAGISFEILRGEILALLGPNGSGKTTTVKMIAGLVLPSSGSAEIMGLNVLKHRTDAMRHLGAVLEGARNVYWQLSARENLRYFGGLRGVPKRQLEKRIDELLLDVGLLADQHRPVGQFSRGMQQKLAIAAALLHDPEVLLLDEPTLGLDVSAARALEDNIARLASERGKSVLLTTHTMPLAEKLAHRVLSSAEARWWHMTPQPSCWLSITHTLTTPKYLSRARCHRQCSLRCVKRSPVLRLDL